MAKGGGAVGRGGEDWGTDEILFDPVSTGPPATAKYSSYDLNHGERGATSDAHGDYKRQYIRGGRGRFGRGPLRNVALRKDEDASNFLPEFAVDVARVLAVMQVIMGFIIILIAIFAYVAKATVGPLIPAMDLGCSVALYITGGVLGLFAKCRAKRVVAAFMILSACSVVAATVLGAIHSLAAFRTPLICAYLHCKTSPEESPRKVMDALIAILSFLEALFALMSLFIGLHGFCKSRNKN